MKVKIILFVAVIVFFNNNYAQEKISLLDLNEIKDFLSLSEEQFIVISENVKRIESIITEDQNIINDIKRRVKENDEPGFFEKIRIKNGRDNRSHDIEDLIDEIEDQLTHEQKTKFLTIQLPKLAKLKKEEIFGK